MPDRTPSGSAPPRGAGRTIKTILKLYFIKNKLKEFIIILTLFILIIKLLSGFRLPWPGPETINK